jgi:hypothetical protein
MSRRSTSPCRQSSMAARSVSSPTWSRSWWNSAHDVTLFASGDSSTTARLVSCRECALRLDPQPLKSEVAAHLSMLDEVGQRADEFDLLHFHLSHFLHFPFFRHIPGKTLTTPHGRLDYVDLAPAYDRFPPFPMISISHSQRAGLPRANWLATVHHGLPPGSLSPRSDVSANSNLDPEAPYSGLSGPAVARQAS